MAYQPPNALVHRYVDIPCPSGKHAQSIVTLRSHTVASLFCLPCEVAWTLDTTHPVLRAIAVDRIAP
jgi:hypothetical protein